MQFIPVLTNYFTVSSLCLGELSALVCRHLGQKVHGLLRGHHDWRRRTGSVTVTAILVTIVVALGRGKDVVQPLGRVDGAVGALSRKAK